VSVTGTFYQDAALADGRSPTLRLGVSVLSENGRITRISPAEDPGPLPPGCELLGEPGAGVIREDGPADFSLVHGDPLSDPTALWRVWRVAS
jgi:hypothetical protein